MPITSELPPPALPLENLLKGSIFSRGFEGTWETQAIMSKSLFMSVLKSW